MRVLWFVSILGKVDNLGEHENCGIAVAKAGRSEYYREYTVDPGMHADPPVIDEALIRFGNWLITRLAGNSSAIKATEEHYTPLFLFRFLL